MGNGKMTKESVYPAQSPSKTKAVSLSNSLSIHGLPKVFDNQHILLRLLWLLCFLSGLGILMYFTITSAQQFATYNVTWHETLANAKFVAMPMIAICDVRTRRAHDYSPTVRLTTCLFADEDCFDDVGTLYNRFSTCLFVNTSALSQMQGGPEFGLELMFAVKNTPPPEGDMRASYKQISLQLFLHEQGHYPMQYRNRFLLSPNYHHDIPLQKWTIDRLGSPYPSNCRSGSITSTLSNNPQVARCRLRPQTHMPNAANATTTTNNNSNIATGSSNNNNNNNTTITDNSNIDTGSSNNNTTITDNSDMATGASNASLNGIYNNTRSYFSPLVSTNNSNTNVNSTNSSTTSATQCHDSNTYVYNDDACMNENFVDVMVTHCQISERDYYFKEGSEEAAMKCIRHVYNGTWNHTLVCPLPCRQTNYKAVVSRLPYESNQKKSAQWTKIMSGRDRQNRTSQHFSIVSLNLFYPDIILYERRETPMYTFASFVSEVGGLMGLFLGASVYSLIEILLLVTVAVWELCRRLAPRSSNNKTEKKQLPEY